MTLGATWKESDGQSVNVDLIYAVAGQRVAYVNGWLGITNEAKPSGYTIALNIARQEFQFEVPAGLAVSKGEIVRIDLTQLSTNHEPPSACYNKSAESATNINLFKATANKSSNNIVTGILLAGL